MPKRIVLETIRVIRDKKTVTPPIGQVFDFTAEEIAQIKAVRPQAFRTVVIEDPELAAAAKVSAETAAASAPKAPTAAEKKAAADAKKAQEEADAKKAQEEAEAAAKKSEDL